MSSFCLAEPLLLDHASFASIHQDVTVRIADRIGVWFLNKSHVMRWAEARFMEAQDRGSGTRQESVSTWPPGRLEPRRPKLEWGDSFPICPIPRGRR